VRREGQRKGRREGGRARTRTNGGAVEILVDALHPVSRGERVYEKQREEGMLNTCDGHDVPSRLPSRPPSLPPSRPT